MYTNTRLSNEGTGTLYIQLETLYVQLHDSIMKIL